jgi:hypothetical protein
MGTNCAPLLAILFLYSYESEFLQKIVKDKKIHEARAFNFAYRYIDDVLLRDVNTICRRSWYIAAHVWKIYDFKIEVVPFVINFSTELTTVVNTIKDIINNSLRVFISWIVVGQNKCVGVFGCNLRHCSRCHY